MSIEDDETDINRRTRQTKKGNNTMKNLTRSILAVSAVIATMTLAACGSGAGPAVTTVSTPAPAKVSTLDAVRTPLFVGYSTCLTGITATPGASVTVGFKFDGDTQPNSWQEQPALTTVTTSDPNSGTFKIRVNFAGLKTPPAAVQIFVGDGAGMIFGGAQSTLDGTGLSINQAQ